MISTQKLGLQQSYCMKKFGAVLLVHQRQKNSIVIFRKQYELLKNKASLVKQKSEGQKIASLAISDGSSEISSIQYSSSTKCGFAKGTEVLMFNGQIEKVENLKVGDLLMGDDSTPRTVVRLTKKYDDMYEITPTFGDKYMVSSQHNLYLKLYKGCVVKINRKNPYLARYMDRESLKLKSKSYPTRESAQAYLNQSTDEDLTVHVQALTFSQLLSSQYRLQQQRSGVEFVLGSKEVDFDPYIIGVWLCKGNLGKMEISNLREQVYEYLNQVINFKQVEQKQSENSSFKLNASSLVVQKLLQSISSNNIGINTVIPDQYKTSGKQIRTQLLAGILDSIGRRKQNENCCVLNFDAKKYLVSDIIYLARSLGLTAYESIRVEKGKSKSQRKFQRTIIKIHISGQELENIPVKTLDLKYREYFGTKNTSFQTLKVNYKGFGKIYGIVLAEKAQFLLGDFTIVNGDIAL